MTEPFVSIQAGEAAEESTLLAITDASGAVTRVKLEGDRRIIGRSREADIHLPSVHVSRRHAELFRDPFARWWIRDLGSQNGTLINGQTVQEHVLAASDEIAIGEFVLRVVLPAARHEHTTTRSASRVTVSRSAVGRLSTLRDHEAPRIARHHLTRLMELYRQLQNVPDLTERYRMLCRTMTSPEFFCKWAGVMRIATDAAEPVPQLLCDPEVAAGGQGQDPGPLSRGLLRAIQAKREPVMAASTMQGAAEVELSMIGPAGNLAAVACPLQQDIAGIDLLYVMLPAEYATGEWLALASLASEQFQHAETARRARAQAENHAALERELTNARHIQMSLTPAQFTCPGLDLSVGFKPCRWVGGDYVDVVPMSEGRVLFAVADVCGKGLPAALLASRVHTGVHSNLGAGLDLRQLMTNLNNYLCKTIPESSFVTMVALTVDVATGHIEYVNAGHPPPVIIQPGAATSRTFAAGENLPLGLEPGSLEVRQEELAPGQMLALYTDGLTELADESGDMLEIEGLCRTLEDICGKNRMSARGTADALTQRLADLLGNQLPQDDQTFLLLQRI